MSNYKKNTEAIFFALLRSGLWEQEVFLKPFGEIDFSDVFQLAKEQCVVGLIAAGLEHVSDVKAPKQDAMQFIGVTLQLMQRNTAMNNFIGVLVKQMQGKGINTLLVKGQGVAQCYERPLWRECGDIDLYLDKDNFGKARWLFKPLVQSMDPDNDYSQHVNMRYGSWIVEIHGNQKGSLSSRINRGMDEIHKNLFIDGKVRSTEIGNTTVYLPSPDNDVLIIFTHFVNHFYKGGLGVRQICDWCRLIWKYNDLINEDQLEQQIRRMGLLRVWKAFAAFAVEFLGMPNDAMPLYSNKKCWKRKANKIASFVIEVGNFGHNRDTSYYGKYPKLIRKMISMWRRFGDTIRHTSIFPLDSLKFLPCEVYYGIRATIKGE